MSTTQARKEIAKLVNHVRETGEVFAIGRRNKPEVIIMKYPVDYNEEVSDITNVNAYGGSFDFLKDEPDLYTLDDVKK